MSFLQILTKMLYKIQYNNCDTICEVNGHLLKTRELMNTKIT